MFSLVSQHMRARGSNVCGRGPASRMPVLFLLDEFDVWLRRSFDELVMLQARCFPDELTATQDLWVPKKPAATEKATLISDPPGATRTAYPALRQRAHEDAWPNPPRLALLAHPHSVTDGPSISGRRVAPKVVAKRGFLASWASWRRPSFRSASSHPASGRPSSRYRTSRAYQRIPLPFSAAT